MFVDINIAIFWMESKAYSCFAFARHSLLWKIESLLLLIWFYVDYFFVVKGYINFLADC